jgi:branched-chain amino acid transport system permease protein
MNATAAVASPDDAIAQLRAASRPRWREAGFWAAAVACGVLFPARLALLNDIAIVGLFALSLDLILGYAGIVSLGHAAFFGFGAYAAGIAASHGLEDPLLGLLIAGVLSMALGFASSFLMLRGADLTRIVISLGVAQLLYELANRLSGWTGGADGLQSMVVGPVLGLFEFDLAGHTAYAYSLAVLFLLFVVARRLVNAPFGWSVRAVKGNPLRSTAIGIDVSHRLIATYSVAAAYAGIAGALLAQTTQFVSLDVLAFHRSAAVLLMLVIGGTGTLYGGLIGAALFRLVQDWLSGLTPQYWEFYIGLILVILVLVGRDRVAALPARLYRSGR